MHVCPCFSLRCWSSAVAIPQLAHLGGILHPVIICPVRRRRLRQEVADHAKLPGSKQGGAGGLLFAEGALKHSWFESKACSNARVSLGQELSSLSLQERSHFHEKNMPFPHSVRCFMSL